MVPFLFRYQGSRRWFLRCELSGTSKARTSSALVTTGNKRFKDSHATGPIKDYTELCLRMSTAKVALTSRLRPAIWGRDQLYESRLCKRRPQDSRELQSCTPV